MGRPAVEVAALSHAYPGGAPALRGVSFSLAAGERAALVGPNGAGKTTLFLRLAGVLPGAPGAARVCGLDPAVSAERRALPAKLGVVFQNPDDQLVAPTLEDDAALGPRNLGFSDADALEAGRAALASVGLAALAARPPHMLSGGEKRKAALAGVLAMRPDVYLFDEPSMFLDPRARRELLAILRGLPGAMLVATHDLDFALDLCGRALLLDGGELVADGPAAEVLGDAALMARHGLEVPWRLR